MSKVLEDAFQSFLSAAYRSIEKKQKQDLRDAFHAGVVSTIDELFKNPDSLKNILVELEEFRNEVKDRARQSMSKN